MEAKVFAAVGSCAILAGAAYILQGQNKTSEYKKGQQKLVSGLVNLGNTCYLNSVLQALASVPTFMLWLTSSCDSQKNGNNKRLTFELSKLLQLLNSGEQISYNPIPIFTSLTSYGWVVNNEQQDAHEVLQVITSTLADEEEFICKKIWNTGTLLTKEDINSEPLNPSIVHRSRAEALTVKRKSLSPFTGLFANQLFCKTCSKRHCAKFDYFDTISLSLPSITLQLGSCSLQGLLRKFVCSEILESFECEGCDKKDNKTIKSQRRLLKKTSVGKLPYCLCFHINRTYWQNNGIPYKNNTFVDFPEVFDIEPFLYTSTDIDSKIPIPVNFPNIPGNMVNLDSGSQIEGDQKGMSSHTRLSINTKYQLVAVIVHSGGVNEGHYVTYRRLQDSRWAYASDDNVEIVSLEKVLQSKAYIIFYERRKE